ncbi:hypothetical protein BamMC406_6625 (plasmid) [Burkholderia ambifaria MC40-6]|uniref:Uncharacterized protein n=1 Tax=Burkholderia ambifaria (strain MC40-6) TaxID=398577 RepID=B1Z6G4_BURA4|nr:hypothetical protein [Burkholderia ambifaria]ACB69041.1 hypothetical protein BamMC406_6625 [Burkholderia ambifaria MC40-6]
MEKLTIPIERPFSNVPPPFGQRRTPFETNITEYWEIFDLIEAHPKLVPGRTEVIQATDFGTANRAWTPSPRRLKNSRAWMFSGLVGVLSGMMLAVISTQRMSSGHDINVSSSVREGVVRKPERPQVAIVDKPVVRAGLSPTIPAYPGESVSDDVMRKQHVMEEKRNVAVQAPAKLDPLYRRAVSKRKRAAVVKAMKNRGLGDADVSTDLNGLNDGFIASNEMKNNFPLKIDSDRKIEVVRVAEAVRAKDFLMVNQKRVTEW